MKEVKIEQEGACDLPGTDSFDGLIDIGQTHMKSDRQTNKKGEFRQEHPKSYGYHNMTRHGQSIHVSASLCIHIHSLLPSRSSTDSNSLNLDSTLIFPSPTRHPHILRDDQIPDILLCPSGRSPSELVVAVLDTSLVLRRDISCLY